jgi:hypothetical protein
MPRTLLIAGATQFSARDPHRELRTGSDASRGSAASSTTSSRPPNSRPRPSGVQALWRQPNGSRMRRSSRSSIILLRSCDSGAHSSHDYRMAGRALRKAPLTDAIPMPMAPNDGQAIIARGIAQVVRRIEHAHTTTGCKKAMLAQHVIVMENGVHLVFNTDGKSSCC